MISFRNRKRKTARPQPAPRRPRCPLDLEALEERAVPTTATMQYAPALVSAPYVLVNGVQAQPAQQQNGTFTVTDARGQQYSLTPGSTQGAYNLSVTGDQLGVNYNDSIGIDNSPNTSGTRVTMNGQTLEFNPGEIKSINVNTGGGYNTVHIGAVQSGETLNVTSYNSTSFDDIIVGNNGSLSGIQGAVNVSNNSGRSWLQTDDSAGPATTITLTDHSVSFANGPTINYTPYAGPSQGSVYGVMGLEIDTPYLAQNQIDVLSVPPYMPVTIEGSYMDHLFGPAASQVGFNPNGFREGY